MSKPRRRALTLWPEWVYAIVHLGKRIENRGWPPPESLIGQPFALHAGKSIGGNGRDPRLDVGSMLQIASDAGYRWEGKTIWDLRGARERSDVTSQLGRKLRWRPGIHMPRWASRISLEVKAVRVERLHDISEADAEAEGVDPRGDGSARYRAAFRLLWCEIYGHASWDANPWLWCVSFARVRP